MRIWRYVNECHITSVKTALAVIMEYLPMIPVSRFFVKGGGLIGLTCCQFLLILLLIASVIVDFKYDRIPNGIIVFGTALGFIFRFRENGWQGILSAGVVILISFCILYPIFLIGGIGAGDVKLLLMTGSFFSADRQLHIMMFSFIIGALLSIVKMISEDNFKERMQYLFSYMMDVLYTGQWKLYGENLYTDSHKYKSNKIHFALPIFLSLMLGLGGIF